MCGPKHVVAKGATPVLTPADTRSPLDGLPDRFVQPPVLGRARRVGEGRSWAPCPGQRRQLASGRSLRRDHAPPAGPLLDGLRPLARGLAGAAGRAHRRETAVSGVLRWGHAETAGGWSIALRPAYDYLGAVGAPHRSLIYAELVPFCGGDRHRGAPARCRRCRLRVRFRRPDLGQRRARLRPFQRLVPRVVDGAPLRACLVARTLRQEVIDVLADLPALLVGRANVLLVALGDLLEVVEVGRQVRCEDLQPPFGAAERDTGDDDGVLGPAHRSRTCRFTLARLSFRGVGHRAQPELAVCDSISLHQQTVH